MERCLLASSIWVSRLICSCAVVGGLICSTAVATDEFSSNPWAEDTLIPPNGRSNPYEVPATQYAETVRAGKLHTQIYPVEVTGLLPPYRPLRNFFEEETFNPLKILIRDFFESATHFHSLNDIIKWVGLHPYPKPTDQGIYAVPYPNNTRPKTLMGYGLIHRNNAVGFSLSCAACHSSNLFGKTLLGLTNRFPRANHVFIRAQQLMPFVEPHFFRVFNHATQAETDLLMDSKVNIGAIGLKEPLVLGLDTSLAQVSLSLSKRNPDPWATKRQEFEEFPRENLLDTLPADSKPAVWWNLKYKDRWLSDGSMVSGNPIFTNILWNEIGRGVDLKILSVWLDQNAQKIKELTTAVFSIESPRITDFFPAEKISIERAKNGEKIFNVTCSECHGHYEKAWSQRGSENLPRVDQLKTVFVNYKSRTRVVDVGTDPNRYLGMKALEKLNNLEISKRHGTIVKPQMGYVPPPLVGIWARWPYFHNNSVPSLCAVLTASSKRPETYYAGEANDTGTDFDFECNGYPQGKKTPNAWKRKQYLYDTQKQGLHNSGHDEDIFLRNGIEIFTNAEKGDLIQFLQTL